MTEQEAIEKIKDLSDRGYPTLRTAKEIAIKALEEVQQYREIGTVEECKELAYIVNIAEKEELAKIIDEYLLYSKIGTVEECREAVEKQKAKKCVQDTCPDHTHYKCPTCGKIQMSEFKRGIRILGRITNFCDNCGQGLESEK